MVHAPRGSDTRRGMQMGDNTADAGRSIHLWSLYSKIMKRFLELQDRLGQDHEISLYLGDAVDAGEGHGHVELRPEQLEHLLNAPLPVAGQAPDDGAADEDHPGAQGQRLQDVRAQGHAAVEVYLGWEVMLCSS